MTDEERAKRKRKCDIQKAYLARKIASETPEDRQARLARQVVYTQAYQARDPERTKASYARSLKKAYAGNPERYAEYSRRNLERNGAKFNANRRERYASDPERRALLAERAKLKRPSNLEHRRAYNALYWAKNAEELAADNLSRPRKRWTAAVTA
jgi:hypothetical protein